MQKGKDIQMEFDSSTLLLSQAENPNQEIIDTIFKQ
jgi:hypothetical protein